MADPEPSAQLHHAGVATGRGGELGTGSPPAPGRERARGVDRTPAPVRGGELGTGSPPAPVRGGEPSMARPAAPGRDRARAIDRPPAGGPGGQRSTARPRTGSRTAALLREALAGDPSASLLGRRGPWLALGVTALYVAAAVGLAPLDLAVSFALVPLVLAATTLSARAGAAVAAATYTAVLVAEVLEGGRGLETLEIVELIAFGALGLGLRLVVVRLTRSQEEIDRVAAELGLVRTQVEEARESTERWVSQLEVVQRAASRMAGRPSVAAVAEAVVDEIRAIVDYHACRVYALREPDDLVPIVAAGDNGYETIALDDMRLKVGQGLAGWVAENGRPLLVPDAAADPRGRRIPGTGPIDESMIVVPMRYDDRVTGVIVLSKLGLHQFDVADVRILSILADQAATAVESARAVGASTALAEDLRRIADMSSALSRSLEPRQVADLIAQHVGGAFGADECTISLWDRTADRLVTQGCWPPERLASVDPYFALASFPETRRVLETQAMATLDAEDPAADPAETALLRREGYRSLVMLPLVAKGDTVGLVELSFVGPLRMEARGLDLARAMANEAAMALGNARLFDTTRNLADRDPLTGFYNHRYLHERLGEEILRGQRAGEPVALLMIDLDDFKLVNDTLGHLFGDEVLRWAAEQIRAELRASDVGARYGGDEFAVILPGASVPEAREVGARIVQGLLDRPYQAEGRGPVPIGASVGAAAFPGDGRTAQALIAGADAALYRVKKVGGRGVEGRVRRGPEGPAVETGAGAQRRQRAG